MIGLLLGIIFRDISVDESFNMARTFQNELVKNKGECPAKNFSAPGCIHVGVKDWWALLTGFVLTKFEKELSNIGFFNVVRATQYGIDTNPALLFVVLELYNPTTDTFFILDGKMGFTLHEMWQILGLPIRDVSYEEYFFGTEEFEILASRDSALYHTLWD